MIEIRGTEAMTKYLLQVGTQMPVAATRALNHTMAKEKTRTAKDISADLGGVISERGVARSLSVTKATPRSLVTTLEIGPYTRANGAVPDKGRGRIPLMEFRARGPFPSRGRGTGVSYSLPGGRGRRADAFIARMPSGHKGVFVRSSLGLFDKSRGAWSLNLPIKELFGPSLRRVFDNKLLVPHVAEIERDLLARTIHEVDVILRGIAPAEAA